MKSLRYRTVMPRLLMLGLSVSVAFGSAVFTQEGMPASAQDGDPPVAALHRGDCGELESAPVADLGVLAPFGQAGDQEVAAVRGMETNGQGVMTASITLDMPFDDVFSMQTLHSLVIHQNAATFGTLLACGELSGAEVDGRVVIGLQPIDDALYAGIAILDDDAAGFLGLGENQTQIATYLVSIGNGRDTEPNATLDAAESTPVVTGENETDQDSEAAQGDEDTEMTQGDQDADAIEAVTVEAVDIDFNPDQFSIPANTDAPVRLVNNGGIEHTFTIDELGIDEVLPPDEEREITINAETGEYVFYCAVPGHREAGQEGTMTVE